MKRKLLPLIALLIAIIMTTSCHQPHEHPQEITIAEGEIEALFDKWNAALQTGDPSAVTALYAQDGVLLPTVSNKVRYNHGEIRDYFVRFLGYQPYGEILENKVRTHGNIALNSGIYAFTLNINDETVVQQARFTYVYKKIGDEWLIIEHHSSAMPEKTE